MIVSEVYNRQNAPSQLHIYSDKNYLLQKDNQLFREAYVNSEEDVNDYRETNLPFPPALATNDFICNALFVNNQLTEPQILAAQPIIEKALNQLEDEDAYCISFLYKPLDTFREYQIGERFLYNNVLYNTIQTALGSQMLKEDWNNYFIKTQCPNNFIEIWKTGQNYQKDEKVKYGSHIYKSLINNNTWSPQDFLDSWELVE